MIEDENYQISAPCSEFGHKVTMKFLDRMKTVTHESCEDKYETRVMSILGRLGWPTVLAAL